MVAAVHDHTDDDLLAARLGAALEHGLDEPVEVTGLLAGARTGARRIRRRRRAGVAVLAVLAAAAVPSGLDALGPHEQAAQVASAPTTPEPEVLATPSTPTNATTPPTPEPSVVAKPPVRSGDDPAAGTATPWSTDVAYDIPDSVAFAADELPASLELHLDLGQYSRLPTVMGQSCQDPSIGGAEPVAGRAWSWSQGASDSLHEVTVDLVVTGWREGTGPEAFTAMVEDTGSCRWMEPQHAQPPGELTAAGDDAWVAEASSNGLAWGRAAVRQGDVLVGVTVQHPDGPAAAAELSRKLAVVAAGRLAETGLEATGR